HRQTDRIDRRQRPRPPGRVPPQQPVQILRTNGPHLVAAPAPGNPAAPGEIVWANGPHLVAAAAGDPAVAGEVVRGSGRCLVAAAAGNPAAAGEVVRGSGWRIVAALAVVGGSEVLVEADQDQGVARGAAVRGIDGDDDGVQPGGHTGGGEHHGKIEAGAVPG